MQYLKKYRAAAKLTQAELADRVGVSYTYISNVETGRHTPSITLAAKIAHALNVTLDEIVYGPEAA